MTRKPTEKRLFVNVALGVTYALTGYLTLALGSTAGIELRQVLWIPSGIAISVSLLVPYRVWPAAALGGLGASLLDGSGLLFSVGTAVANGFEVGFGTWSLRRLGFAAELERPRDTLLLVTLGAGAAAAFAALISVIALVLTGGAAWPQFGRIWLLWWLTHAMGILMVVPTALAASRRVPLERSGRRHTAGILLVVLVATWIPFSAPTGSFVAELFFIPLLLLLFAAIRTEMIGATLGPLILTVAAIAGAVLETGPFAGGTPNQTLFLTWSFTTVTIVAVLVAGAAAGERTRAAHRVVVGAQRLRAVLDATGDGILVANSSGSVTDVNTTMVELAGQLGSEDCIGNPATDLLKALDPVPDLSERERELLGAGVDSPVRLEAEVELQDGRFVAVSTAPLTSGELVTGRIWSVRDVTDRVQSERERQRLQDQLLHSQKLEGLGVLAGGVAHDFNNLLMGITGYADLLRTNHGLDAQGRADAKGIIDTAAHASDLCNQMLAYAGKATPALTPVDLSACAADIRKLLAVSVSKSVDLSLKLPEEAVFAMADEAQIRQVLLNLVTNGSEAVLSGPGSGSVQITVGSAFCNQAWLDRALIQDGLKPGVFAILQVEDDGVGLEPRVVNRIFDPFFSSKGTGRGLGLSATLGVIRTHGGTIVVDSQKGRGSKFQVALPRVESTPKSGDATPLPLKGGGQRTILVVDDEEHVRQVVARMVERAGFRTILASDGDEALAILDRSAAEIDLVLLDLTMPRRDGLSTLKEIRERGMEVPVLVASGYSRESLPVDVSISGFVHKPFRMHALHEALEAILFFEEGGQIATEPTLSRGRRA